MIKYTVNRSFIVHHHLLIDDKPTTAKVEDALELLTAHQVFDYLRWDHCIWLQNEVGT